MRTRVVTAVWVAVVWVALWGDVTWGNALGGLAVGTVVQVAVRLPDGATRRRPALGPSLRFGVVFARDLTVATWQVARQVLWPAGRLRPAIVAVPLRSNDPGLVALVANAITLTPGTLTIEADDERRMLWVHVLHLPEGGADHVVAAARATERLGAAALRIDLGGESR